MSATPRRHTFPIARRVWAFARRAVANWRERHQHPVNFALHMAGIPMTLVGLAVLIVDWRWAAGLFAGGYLLQFVGHWVEGNDVGELIPLKRALGLKVVPVVPRNRPPA